MQLTIRTGRLVENVRLHYGEEGGIAAQLQINVYDHICPLTLIRAARALQRIHPA